MLQPDKRLSSKRLNYTPYEQTVNKWSGWWLIASIIIGVILMSKY